MPPTQSLGSRKSAVLRALVRDHIRTAEPVGSGRLAFRYRLGVSPATIRNDMAALEEMGYLAQPHTSAGRIPTDLGYRFYVDSLPPRLSPTDSQRRTIAASLGEPLTDVEDALRRTSQLLSRLTHYAAVALSPVVGQSRVVRAELVALGSATLLLVVSDTGRVDRRALDLAEGAGRAARRRVSEVLASSFGGLSYGGAADRAGELGVAAPDPERGVLDAVAQAFRGLEEDPSSEHVFVGGAANIAGEEAFERRETVRRMFEALEEEAALPRFLRRLVAEAADVTVRIGRENPMAAFREASVIVAGYRAGGRPAGTIAVIGPTRMEYPVAIAAVRAVARRVSDAIDVLAG